MSLENIQSLEQRDEKKKESSVVDDLQYNQKHEEVKNGLHGKNSTEVSNRFSKEGVEHKDYVSGSHGNTMEIDTTNAELKKDAAEALREKARIEKAANQEYAEAQRNLENIDVDPEVAALDKEFQGKSAELEEHKNQEMADVDAQEKNLNKSTFDDVQNVILSNAA